MERKVWEGENEGWREHGRGREEVFAGWKEEEEGVKRTTEKKRGRKEKQRKKKKDKRRRRKRKEEKRCKNITRDEQKAK